MPPPPHADFVALYATSPDFLLSSRHKYYGHRRCSRLKITEIWVITTCLRWWPIWPFFWSFVYVCSASPKLPEKKKNQLILNSKFTATLKRSSSPSVLRRRLVWLHLSSLIKRTGWTGILTKKKAQQRILFILPMVHFFFLSGNTVLWIHLNPSVPICVPLTHFLNANITVCFWALLCRNVMIVCTQLPSVLVIARQ